MATATRTRRTRAEAPAVQNVQLASGRRGVHALHPDTNGAPFPACRPGQRNSLRTSRYVATTAPVDCEKCLEQADQLPQERVNTAGRVKKTDRTPTGDPYRGKTSPRAARARRNGTAQAEAEEQAQGIVAAETAKIVAKRTQDPARLKGCTDEEYALAEKVREYRANGTAWWKIGLEMGLKGAGTSAKTGKTGAAHARRLWEKAWGKTYTDTSVPRETKGRMAERAVTEPGKPYFAADVLDAEVIDAVQGHEITWVCRVGAGDGVVTSVQKAIVKPGTARVVQGPKGRVVNFFEMVKDDGSVKLGSGPQRSVYIERIEKVAL